MPVRHHHRLLPLTLLGALSLSTVAFAPAASPATSVAASASADVPAAADSTGTEFWLAFTRQIRDADSTRTLLLTGDGASGTVAVPGLGIEKTFTTTPGETTAVSLPRSVLVPDNGPSSRGVHVTADGPIAVVGMNEWLGSADGFLGLPTDALGSTYVAGSYPGATFQGDLYPSTLVVVATQDDTTVQLSEGDGVVSQVTLGAGETFSVAGEDVTGTTVESDAPVAVFGGAVCAYVPTDEQACDHLVEQLVPVERWGRTHVIEPFADRSGGDVVRVVAALDDTAVSVDGTQVATLDRGDHHELVVSGQAVFEGSEPIQVLQLLQGATVDGSLADPAMTVVPAVAHHRSEHTVATPAAFEARYLNVVVPDGAQDTVRLDGQLVAVDAFDGTPGSGWVGAQLRVGAGVHTVTADVPVGVVAYGYDFYDSYAFPAGLAFPAGCDDTGPVSGPIGSVGGDTVGDVSCSTLVPLESGELPTLP